MTDALPPYITRAEVQRRLPLIFPEGSPNRLYCTREMAASTVFALLYIGAVEGTGRFLGPKHVYRMSDEQASLLEDDARLAFAQQALKPSFAPAGKPWYADTTREPIRDETLREGLVAVGAVVVREGVPTTSSKPRYALVPDFAALFDPGLTSGPFDAACVAWQQARLSAGALARVQLQRAGAAAGMQGVLVTFPSGETRRLVAGPSSIITKAVVEEFATAFLEQPAVIWLSESGNKVVARDDKLASQIGLGIRPDKDLPDIILADLGPSEPLLVFVEVVATDGPVTSRRQQALLEVAAAFHPENVAFVTAYRDREAPAFRKTFGQIAWRSFVWFASEPRQIVGLHDTAVDDVRLSELLWLRRPMRLVPARATPTPDQ